MLICLWEKMSQDKKKEKVRPTLYICSKGLLLLFIKYRMRTSHLYCDTNVYITGKVLECGVYNCYYTEELLFKFPYHYESN